jgi:hypothetical protein
MDIVKSFSGGELSVGTKVTALVGGLDRTINSIRGICPRTAFKRRAD